MLARSECVSVVPGSAYRPFLLDTEVELDAEDKVWEGVRVLIVGRVGDSDLGRSGCGSEKLTACMLNSLVSILPLSSCSRSMAEWKSSSGIGLTVCQTI